jgi:hypothetical protein
VNSAWSAPQNKDSGAVGVTPGRWIDNIAICFSFLALDVVAKRFTAPRAQRTRPQLSWQPADRATGAGGRVSHTSASKLLGILDTPTGLPPVQTT